MTSKDIKKLKADIEDLQKVIIGMSTLLESHHQILKNYADTEENLIAYQ